MSTKNPEIRWHEWSRETLELANSLDKPILLSISATWCHWCHVMDQKTLSDPQVIDIINSKFIPVRADTDRRPDLNDRYNMGGWPTIALLTPEGDALTGATFLPSKRMIELLDLAAKLYEERHDELKTLIEEKLKEPETEIPEIQLSIDMAQEVLQHIEDQFDPVYGGFGTAQKFPYVPVLEFLLSSYRRVGHRSYLEMATKTLDAMRDGGIHDETGGGFFRYSTNRDWSVPHYEKMLEDNAGLISIYTHAYGLTGESRYLETAESIICYLEETLFDEDTKAFFGSQDADEAYYKLSEEAREKIVAPSIDRTIYTDWNSKVADAYMRFYEATGDYAQLERAIGILDFMLDSCRIDGCFYHYCDRAPKEPGMLSDQVWAGIAFLRGYECTGNRRYFDAARDTANTILPLFADERGGFFDVNEDRLGNQSFRRRLKILDQNAQAARFFTRLSYYAHEPSYRTIAEAALRSMAFTYQSYGLMAASYAQAVVELLEEPVKVAVTGPRDDPKTQALIASTFHAKDPSSLVQILDDEASEQELDYFRIRSVDRPHAAICIGSICHQIDNPEMLRTAILEAEETRG